jgi:MFS family permease
MAEVHVGTRSDEMTRTSTGAPDELPITTPGTRYALGRGAAFYGVWDVSAPEATLLEQFPFTAEGWFAARRRIEALERPLDATTGPEVPQAKFDRARTVHAGVILVGVALGIAGLFPAYLSDSSLANQGAQLLPHIAYLVTWAVVASLLLSDRRFVRAAAGIGVGLGAMTLGFFLTDVATAATSHGDGAGAGLYLSIAGWFLATSGCVAAMLGLRAPNGLGLPTSWHHPRVLFGGALGLAIAAAFALPWDRYVISAATAGSTETISAGNVFANPGGVIAADLVVMVLTFAVLLVAFAWRPVVVGATLAIGALVPLAAQLFSTLIQATPPLSEFGVSAAQASAAQVTLTAGYTGWFYIYCALVAAVVIALGWLATAPSRDPSR